MGLFTAATAVSAFLLFAVQPMLARYILPWFGGQPAVWGTCLVFFQLLLVVGYGYAHLLAKIPRLRVQGGLHLMGLACALLLLPVTPDERWKPIGSEDPAWRILQLLSSTVAVPYLLLAATSPLLQSWQARLFPDRPAHRLYAWSNVASLVALWSYPFLVEPLLGRQDQTRWWSSGFIVFAGLLSACAWQLRQVRMHAGPIVSSSAGDRSFPEVTAEVRVLWLALPLVASLLLVAITNAITLDIAPVPLLWVLPLGAYLLTFAIVFAREGWYRRAIVLPLGIAALGALVWVMGEGENASLVVQVFVHVASLFVLTFALHGELARLRPAPHQLTSYYFVIALGGAAGSAFVALLAPRLFLSLLELPIGLVLAVGLLLFALLRDPGSLLKNGRPVWAWTLLLCGFVVLAGMLWQVTAQSFSGAIALQRSFFGVRSIKLENVGRPNAYLALRNGRIYHGIQYQAPYARRRPASYYDKGSGIDIAFDRLRAPAGTRRIGMIGLGIGTTLAYCRAGDTFQIYEIDPTLEPLVRRHFSFLNDAACAVTIRTGDARLTLEREASQRFDLLIVDAFSSDAIPTHLLTVEAFRSYVRHLAPEGVLLLHISNRHLVLAPVIEAAAKAIGFPFLTLLTTGGTDDRWTSDWVAVSRDFQFLQDPALQAAASKGRVPPRRGPPQPAWTDDKSSLAGILRGVPVYRWPYGWTTLEGQE